MLTESVPFLDRVLRHLGESGWEDWLAKVIVAVAVSALGALALWLWSKAWPRLRTIWGAKRRLDRALLAVGAESKGLWLASSIPVRQPSHYDRSLRTSKPIIVVANLKGGVGKTTVTSNLIAHYANKKGERVLGIDLDFQGSLTANCLSGEDRQHLLEVQDDGGLSKAAQLIDDRDAAWLRDAPDSVDGVATAKLIPAYYSLAAVENRVMVEWLLGKRRADVRYHLADLLHDDIIQRSFDRIFIDAPPRLTQHRYRPCVRQPMY
ncbi:MAG: ParA family protein [Hyphomicrobium sp.]